MERHVQIVVWAVRQKNCSGPSFFHVRDGVIILQKGQIWIGSTSIRFGMEVPVGGNSHQWLSEMEDRSLNPTSRQGEVCCDFFILR